MNPRGHEIIRGEIRVVMHDVSFICSPHIPRVSEAIAAFLTTSGNNSKEEEICEYFSLTTILHHSFGLILLPSRQFQFLPSGTLLRVSPAATDPPPKGGKR